MLKLRACAAVAVAVSLVFAQTAFSGTDDNDMDYSGWDSWQSYPADVMGTKLLTPVKYLMDRGIVTGDSDGLFHPEKSITRAELATMMAKATNNLAELQAMADKEYFSDLEGYSWAKMYINAVAKAELFKGRGNGKFAPGESVTNAEVITVLVRTNKGSADRAEEMAAKWPDNFIRYAETYNLLGEVVIDDWEAPATKGDVAQLLYRFMPKDSDSWRIEK